MRVALTFEPFDVLPPELYTQIVRRIARVLDEYGVQPNVVADRDSQLEAFQRFYEWNAKRMADEFPKTPADAEVK